MLRRGIMVVLLAPLPALAGSVAQLDWSQGGPVAGPVADWGGSFEAADNVATATVPGQIVLAGIPLGGPFEQRLDRALDGAIKVWADDVDGDGDQDVLATGYWADRLNLYLNQGGAAPVWRRQTIDDSLDLALAVRTADLDADGRTDILGGAGGPGELVWWRNPGGDPIAWQRHRIDGDLGGVHDVAAADLDGDHDLDVVAADFERDQVVWYRNEGGAASWTRFEIDPTLDYPVHLATGDVDGDGRLDIATTAWNDELVGWWRNAGGDPVVWVWQAISESFTGTHWVELADVDRDGRLDVLAAAMDRGELAWWHNGGGTAPTWTRHVVTQGLAGAVAVAAADLDGDGDLDVAGAGWSPVGGVGWWENRDGSGGQWLVHWVERGYQQASSVAIADVDGDGALDVLATSWQLDSLAWWRVTAFRDAGSLTSSILDVGSAAGWVAGEWLGDLPAATGVTLLARVGEHPAQMGPWTVVARDTHSGTFWGGGARYLQYRLVLASGDPAVSPMIRAVRFAWVDPPPPRVPGARIDGS